MKKPFIKIDYSGGVDIFNTDYIVNISTVTKDNTNDAYGTKISYLAGDAMKQICYYKKTKEARDKFLNELFDLLNEPITTKK